MTKEEKKQILKRMNTQLDGLESYVQKLIEVSDDAESLCYKFIKSVYIDGVRKTIKNIEHTLDCVTN